MVKTRKIKLGDFVTHAGKEWVVTKKYQSTFRLVRRMVKTGAPIIVPKKRVKLSDQTWRKLLMPGDPIQLFLGGQWTNAAVFLREESNLIVQPSLSNFTLRISEDAGIITQASHSFPLWVKDEVTPVLFNGSLRMERGKNLLFPWDYAEFRIPVSGPIREPLTTLSFPMYTPEGFQFSAYKNLTKEEIMWDIFSHAGSHPPILQLLAKQFCSCQLPTYAFLGGQRLQTYITAALAADDHRRVQELLSVGSNERIFSKNEWLVRTHLAHPYIDCEFTVTKKNLKVQLIYSGMKVEKLCPCVHDILQQVSEPMVYSPERIAVDGSPEIQYVLSRMLGMEKTPVALARARHINGTPLTLDKGMHGVDLSLCGGQVNAPHIDAKTLIKELVKRSSMKTLIVVETNAIKRWKEFNIYHGRHRKITDLTVTTKSLLSRAIQRGQSTFSGTERLICVMDTGSWSSFTCDSVHFKCKVKWAFGAVDGHPFGTSPESELKCDNSRLFINSRENDALCINLSKAAMINMGVQFPQVTYEKIFFNFDKQACKELIQKQDLSCRYLWERIMYRQQLRLFLMHPELLDIQMRGERLDAIEATLGKIAEKCGVSEQLLDSRTQETCAVCLETITDATITPCGHVFCATCMKELHSRRIKCPMCRSKIPSFLKLSDKDTDGKVVVHRGVPYRVPENEKWGEKMKFLRKHADATFVTNDTKLRKKLQKVFRKTTILTDTEIRSSQLPNTDKVILLHNLPYTDPHGKWKSLLSRAWGKDVRVIELNYHLEDKPYGVEFY